MGTPTPQPSPGGRGGRCGKVRGRVSLFLMSRGFIICCAVVVGLVTLMLLGVTAHRQGWLNPPHTYDAQRLKLARGQMHELAAQWVKEGKLAREDGWVYTVDVGHLLMAAAISGDVKLYESLRQYCLEHLILNDPARPDAQDMVIWRYQPGVPADASGTTETLRVALGFWLGAGKFQRAADRALAVRMLKAYARHQSVEQNTWLIRNYYNLGTRAFATNSFTIDYAPDFVMEVAEAVQDEELKQVAQKSYGVIHSAVAPCGLIYDFIQPEVATIIPSQSPVFGPNDLVQLSNSAAIAEHACQGAPEVGRTVLHFALVRLGDLRLYFLGRTGEVPFRRPTGPEAYTALLRLAVKLDDQVAVRRLTPFVTDHALAFASKPYAPRMFLASELMLALEMVGE